MISSLAGLARRPRLLEAVLLGGFAVGVLDFLDAVVFYRAAPLRIGQSIAAGVLGGATAFAGGVGTAALGVALHFFIATSIAFVYAATSLKLPLLIRRAVPCGLVYGIAVYYFMNYVVVPLSAINRWPTFSWPGFLNGVLGHALLVGLPVALITRRAARV
jgi:uncharacterized membrane protein YagU involved in acid resistance